MTAKRVFLVVLDSLGAGEAPDAAAFGDLGANTLRSIRDTGLLRIPTLGRLGIGNIDGLSFLGAVPSPAAAFGKMRERSAGKDTTIGHWEMAGMISPKPFPVYPDGFPKDVLDEFRKQTGREVLCNKPYSGTEVIKDYGREHMETGALIVYTSADSVFQIAAHEDVVPVETLYEYCKIARKILVGKYAVGRVIARPFIKDENGNFIRTPRRHDFSLEPPGDTLLDVLNRHGKDTIAVGKIYDIFAHRGMSEHYFTTGNTQGIAKTLEISKRDFNGLCYTNLVDCDMLYGHRRDIDGYARAISEFDECLPELCANLNDDDFLMITADHGCDPGYKGTDHTREYVPLIIYSKSLKSINLKTVDGFGVVCNTALSLFGINEQLEGENVIDLIK